MEELFKFAKRLAEAFEGEDLDYAFTGALAVSFYGAPRTTSDIDVIIAIPDKADAKSKVLMALKKAKLEENERRIDEALTSDYNIATFHNKKSAYTVDVIFSVEKLEKQAGKIAGLNTFFQKPEGLVLAKLRMIKATLPRERAAKDEEDVKAILTFAKLNLEDVKKQARKDKTSDILKGLIESGGG
jgi:hypothetical protein